MLDDDDDVSTVATILRSLDVVLLEIERIDTLLQEAPRDVTNISIIHEARRRTNQLFEMGTPTCVGSLRRACSHPRTEFASSHAPANSDFALS
jgi:hypothetical protein